MTNHIKQRGLRPSAIDLEARKKRKNLEHKLQTNVIKELEIRGFVVIRHNSGSFSADANRYFKAYTIVNLGKSSGLSDLQVFKNGKSAFLEVKKDDKTDLNSNQKEVQKLMQSVEIPYIKIGSYSDLENFLKIF